MADTDLPPLPEAPIIGTSRFGSVFRGYSADHMRSYARAAMAAAAEPAQLAAQYAEPEGWREFLIDLSKQEPEKPDNWSSCGQCDRNISRAEDLLTASPQPPAQQKLTQADHVAQALAEAHTAPPLKWPAGRDVGRAEDMGQGHLRVVLDSDNDVCVAVWDGQRSASVEFCNGLGGGGRSMRTRMALIALMVAMEADNAESPSLQRPERARAAGAQGGK